MKVKQDFYKEMSSVFVGNRYNNLEISGLTVMYGLFGLLSKEAVNEIPETFFWS